MKNKEWITDKVPPMYIPIIIKSDVGITVDTYYDIKYFKENKNKIYGWKYLSKGL